MSQLIQLIRGDDFPRFVRFVEKVNPDIHENADEALVEAVRCENRKMVNFLLKRGANVHARNDFALRLASREGFDAIEELLVKHGASQDVFEEYDNDEDPEHEHSGRYYFGTSKLTPKKRQQIFTEGLARYLVDTRDVTALPRTLRQWCERNEIELERRVRAAILKDAVEKWHEMEAEESDEEEEEFEAESEDEVSSCGSASESEEEEVSESEEEASSDEEEETPVTTTAPTTAAESVSDDESEKSDTESAAESDTDDEEIPVIVPHVIRAPRPPSPRPQEAVA